MARNNKSTNIFKTENDRIRRAREIKKTQEKFTKEKYNMTKDELETLAESIFQGREAVLKSNIGTVANNKYKYSSKNAIKNYEYNKVTSAIQRLHENKFYDVIADKVQTGEETMIKAIESSKKIKINNQKGKSNENLSTVIDKYHTIQNIKDNNGSFFVYDLETLGGKDAHGIWRPTHITEYSMHEYNAVNGEAINKTDIVLGWTEKEGKDLFKRIETAIKDGTIEHDDELRITAHRLSLYGDDKTKVTKTDKGYYKVSKFIDSEDGDYLDLKRIEAGKNLFVNIGNEMRKKENLVDGMPADIKAMMESVAHTNKNLKKDYSMLIDYNGTLHDLPILNSVGNQYLDQFPQLREKLFKNGFTFAPSNDTHLDFMGMLQHYSNNFSNKDILGDHIKGIKDQRLNRQEHYIKALYKEKFDELNLPAHVASSDVTALNMLITEKTDELDGVSLFDYIGNKLEELNSTKKAYELTPGADQILEAKQFANGTYGGKNIMNFAIDKEGNVFTADNHMIRNGVAQKKDFNVGTGLNQGQFYKLKSMKDIEANDEYIQTIKEIFPQYTSKNLYSVTLDMVTSDDFEGSRMEGLSQVFLFDSETERSAFLGNNMNIVAQNGKVINRDTFDVREYDMINRKPVYKDVNKNYAKTDKELINDRIKFNMEKLSTSRAENAINGDNAYRKIQQALEIQEIAKENMGRNINNRELNYIMSDRVAKGKMAMSIEESVREKMQTSIRGVLEWQGEMYDSTVDNMSTYMNTISNNEAYYKKLYSILKQDKRFEDDIKNPAAIKKELFKRVDRYAKESLANGIYSGSDSRIKKSILGDESLKAPLSKFKNMYELDMSLLPGAKRDFFFDVTQSNPGNLLRLDMEKNNLGYDLINGVRKALHGDRKINAKDSFQLHKKDFRGFIGMMLEDKEFSESISKDFYRELKSITKDKADYHPIDVANRITQQISEIKKANPFAGIKSKELYMKDLTSSSGFIKALNSDTFLKSLEEEVPEYLKQINLTQINGSMTKAKSFVKDYMLDSYVPKNPTELVHKNAIEEMTNYLSELIYSIDKIGAVSSLGKDGTLTMVHEGKQMVLDLPKIKADSDSGVWYMQTGSMKNKLYNILDVNSTKGGYGVDMSLGTNFGESVGSFPMSKTVERFHMSKGNNATKESMDYINLLVKSGKKKIISNPTINGFNGNDLNSNRLIDTSKIVNVMQEMFGENGKLNYLVKNKEFLDSNLQDVLGKDLARYMKSGKPIEELDANMTKDLIKNATHIFDILGLKANVAGTDVEEALNQLSYTTNEKQMSKMIGILGDMPLFSPQAALDNLQRPPVIAAGNAIPLRLSAVKALEAEGSGVLSGNLISSASIDKATMRYVSGVGQTTTDVMMDIAYVSTNALDIMKANNINKVLSESNVDDNYKKRMIDMFSKLNTYEQERHLDGRIAEKLYGLMPAKVQNISASKDLKNAIHLMDHDQAMKQMSDLIDLKGNITVNKSGVLSYKSATGKFVKRGDTVAHSLGFGDKLEVISPKMQNGVFLHKYLKSNGMTLTDSEISKILNQNKDLFFENGKFTNNLEAITKLDKLLEDKYSTSSMFRIQDIGAAGFIKPTTSSTEKGMTNLNYVKTGALNKDVDQFFKTLGLQDISRQTVLTDEGLDALLTTVKSNDIKKALKVNFGSIDKLKQAMDVERNAFNKFLMEDMFKNKAHMLVNDGVAKHGGAGQLQFGMLNKAIDNLIKKNGGNLNKTFSQVTDIINENDKYQFLQFRDLNNNKTRANIFSIKDGRIQMEDMGTHAENLTISNIKKLENLITRLDKEGFGNLVHEEGYIQQLNKKTNKLEIVDLKETGQKIFGEWLTEEIDGKQVFTTPITKESVKLLPDVETQTGTENRYFELKETIMNLKSRKNSSNDQREKLKLSEDIATLEKELRNYEFASKRMSIGSTEHQLLERIRVTDQHAKQMQDLMAKGELSDEILASAALKGKIHLGDDNLLKADESLKAPVLDHWLQRFKGQITFNPQEELKLTAKDLERDEFKHLTDVYNRSTKYGYEIGQDSAQKLYQMEMAHTAVKYNDANNTNRLNKQGMLNKGFELKSIEDINFEVDEIAKKNLLIDLGPEFEGSSRYVAVAGTGHIMGDGEEEILTNGQKQIKALRHKYDDWKNVKHDSEAKMKAEEKILNQVDEAKSAIKQSIYGKNAYADSLNKIQVDDVNYRYKASGAVTSEFTPGLSKAIKNGDSNIRIDNDLLDNRFINGKSLSQWHKEGVHYDYKFVSTEAMRDMGMFKEANMKAYGAKNEQEMIEMLKKHGTMDITDRYPNNRNDSMLLSHVFLDTELQGNETKVAGVSGLKMNLDHDGDSVSSFALRYKTSDGIKLDYGMFKNNPEYVKRKSQEAYDAFANMEAVTTVRAATENKKWLDDVSDILVKDVMKNSGMGDLSTTALVPGGTSNLGKMAPAGLSRIGSLESVQENNQAVVKMVDEAKKMLENDTYKNNAKINIKADNLDLDKFTSGEVLDKALTVMEQANKQGLVADSLLKQYESDAIRKIGIDKASIAATAKTGLATTGGINVATNSVKKAAHDTLQSKDPLSVDLLRSVLDIPEQEAISSKKIKSAYNDTRARDMSEILNNMFDDSKNRTSMKIDNRDLDDLSNWFDKHARSKVESVYDEFAPRLDSNVVESVNKGRLTKFDAIMNKTKVDLEKLSADEFFQSKRMNYKSRGYAAMEAGNTGEAMSSRVGQAIGLSDDSYKIRYNESRANEEAKEQIEYSAKKVYAQSATIKEGKSMISEVIDTMSHGNGSLNIAGGLGMAALGLAGGLMAAGYASGNPLNDKQASQVAGEQQSQEPVQTMSVPEFMDKQGGFVTGNSQQGYIINIKADTRKGRKHMQRIMKQAASASVGGAVSVNMNIRNSNKRGISDSDIENFLDRNL